MSSKQQTQPRQIKTAKLFELFELGTTGGDVEKFAKDNKLSVKGTINLANLFSRGKYSKYM